MPVSGEDFAEFDLGVDLQQEEPPTRPGVEHQQHKRDVSDPVNPGPAVSPDQVAEYNQQLSAENNRFQRMLQNIMNSPYMPNREQVIQLVTTLLTLMLMMVLGPALGSQAGLVQMLVRQLAPFLVAAVVHYAADQTAPMQKPTETSITRVQLQPVEVQRSAISQAI